MPTRAASRRPAPLATRTSRPAPKSNIQSEIERDLRAWVRRFGRAGTMPSRGELTRSGHAKLASRIHHHGGSAGVARRLGLKSGARAGSRAAGRRR